MPSTLTNQADYRKTSTKLRWTSALEGGYCHGVVPILLGKLLDLGKRPLSVAMATGISMVMLVALATSPSASLT
jgi:hypothetical protein